MHPDYHPPIPPRMNGHPQPYWPPAADPLAIVIGHLDHRMDRVEDKLEAVSTRLADGQAVHADLTRRVSTLESRPDRPPWSIQDVKLTIGAIVFLVLILLGKVELAQQALSAIGGK